MMGWRAIVLALPLLLTAEELMVTGRPLVVHGVSQVPVGLFGVHAADLTPEQYAEWGITAIRSIQTAPPFRLRTPGRDTPPGVPLLVDCLFDRYQPALCVSDPSGWRATLTEEGRRYGAASAATDVVHHVEFWNEPYLNWSTKPGVNDDPRFYELGDAVEGGPVRLRGEREPTEFLVWKRGRWFVPDDGRSFQDTYVAVGNGWHTYGLQDLPAGSTWSYRGKTHRVIETLVPYDRSKDERPASARWFSARQNALWYNRMFGVFGAALKQADPRVQLIGGWGFHLHQSNWLAWESLFKPLIDENAAILDGIGEHHYGGDTRAVAGAYQTANAYALATRGRGLTCYNTEAGSNWDPQRPDQQRDPLARWFAATYSDPALQQCLAAYRYLVRDVVHLLATAPDLAVARAAHQPQLTAGGDELAFRQLKALRGPLVACSGSTGGWLVASRPSPERLAIVCFNDTLTPSDVAIICHAPAGTVLTGGVQRGVAIADGRARLQEVPVAVTGTQSTIQATIPPQQAIVWEVTLAGTGAPERPIALHRCPADRILITVKPDTPAAVRFVIPPERLAAATRARVTLVTPPVGEGRLVLEGASGALPLPGGAFTRSIALDSSWMPALDALTLRCVGDPVEVWMVAIDLIAD